MITEPKRRKSIVEKVKSFTLDEKIKKIAFGGVALTNSVVGTLIGLHVIVVGGVPMIVIGGITSICLLVAMRSKQISKAIHYIVDEKEMEKLNEKISLISNSLNASEKNPNSATNTEPIFESDRSIKSFEYFELKKVTKLDDGSDLYVYTPKN